MRYQKPLNLWQPGIQEGILSGAIKLQTGQWLKCGTQAAKPCRYVSHNGRTINVVHWQGTTEATNQLFNKRLTKNVKTKSES